MTKDDFFTSINSNTRLTKDFFLKVYGFELSYPGFAEMALDKLEELGRTKARDYYIGIVGEYEQKQEKVMKNVAEWYRKQEFYRKKGDDNYWILANTHQSSLSVKQNDSLQKRLDRLKECL